MVIPSAVRSTIGATERRRSNTMRATGMGSAWNLPETATLIFIDKEGFKSAEKHFDEFLTELDKGLSTLIVEDSVIDKALSSVFSSLNTY